VPSADVSRLAFIVILLTALAASSAAFAHASLVRTEPIDGATLAEAPKVLTLTFNEPVSPLVIRLIGPGGEITAPPVLAQDRVVTVTPPQLRQGTHVLSWRVVSADGHPVGGSLLFSVGAASGAAAGAPNSGDAAVRSALWAAKLAVYAALFLGVGGVFFGVWVDTTTRARGLLVALLAAGLAVTLISLGLQGLDALDLPISGLARTPAPVYHAGFFTAYGTTVLAIEGVFVVGLFALAVDPVRLARALALVALLGTGLALALSGHAGSVEPRWLTRTVVFLHAVCVAFWIGALIPLSLAIRAGDQATLARFSRLIPVPLAVLVATGAALVIVQFDRFDALWTTRYGFVLAGKLGVVAVVLALAAANRYALVPRFQAAGAAAARPLATSIRSELVLALVVLALVALWRFTPPPRALAAAPQVSFHVNGERAKAQIDIAPVRGRGGRMGVRLLDAELRPLAAKELTLVFANPAAGIEPMRRAAVSDGDAGDGNWRIDDLRIPVAGRGHLRVEILINDFEKIVIEDDPELRQMP
jgi:copper transport protein